MNKKLLLTLLVSSALVGCGGGSGGSGGSSDDSPEALSGKAIDGYLSNATVFLDKNFNGEWDSGEPKTTTNSNGEYSFTEAQTGSCKGNAPIVVNVTTESVDSDDGLNVDRPYTLMLPPTNIASNSRGDVTPLSSMVWEDVMSQALEQGVVLTCDNAIDPNSTEHAWLMSAVSASETKVISDLNNSLPADQQLDADNLYSDYVASGDEMIHQEAKKIVEEFKVVEELESQNDLLEPGETRKVSVLPSTEYGKYRIDENTINTGDVIVLTTVRKVLTGYDSVRITTKVEKISESMVDGEIVQDSELKSESSHYESVTSSYYNKTGSIFFADDNSCVFEDDSQELTGDKNKVYTYKTIDSGVTTLMECGGSYDTVSQRFWFRITDSVDSNDKIYSEADYNAQVVTPPSVGSDVNGAMSTFFSDLVNVEFVNALDFDQSLPMTDLGYFEKQYLDYQADVDGYDVTKYNSDGKWWRETDNGNSPTEYACLNFKSHLNGAPFDTATSPLDYWSEEADDAGDRVWINVGSDISALYSTPICTVVY